MINTVKAFNDYAENYDRWFDDPKGRILFELEVKAIRLLMKDLVPPFLEIGTGSGRFAAALGIRFGIDPSETLLEMAKKRGIKTERAFGETLPFPKDIFGGVFILFTLCFVKEPRKVIAEAKRVLRPGGGLIIGFINRESPWGELYMKKKAEGHPVYKHASFFSISEIIDLISTVGFINEASSSALTQPPSKSPREHDVREGIAANSGFICTLARKGKP